VKSAQAKGELVGQQQALDAYFDALFNCEASVTVSAEVPLTATSRQTEAEVATGLLRVQVFNVVGITLAVPLERLQAVVENRSDLAPTTAFPEPVVGAIPWNGGQVPVVDTARLVLPQDRAAKLGADSAERCRHLLIVDDGRCALGCNNVADVVELADVEIKWRTAEGKRPWLAGIAAQRRCALLDVDGLIRLLDDSMA
jgi:purine-binding chemotaxis protein CheW